MTMFRTGPDSMLSGARECRAGTADGLRDPGGEPVVVDTERLVVALKRPVEVLAIKENADLHGRLPGDRQTVNSLLPLMVDVTGRRYL